jgi:hypothetical protein
LTEKHNITKHNEPQKILATGARAIIRKIPQNATGKIKPNVIKSRVQMQEHKYH